MGRAGCPACSVLAALGATCAALPGWRRWLPAGPFNLSSNPFRFGFRARSSRGKRLPIAGKMFPVWRCVETSLRPFPSLLARHVPQPELHAQLRGHQEEDRPTSRDAIVDEEDAHARPTKPPTSLMTSINTSNTAAGMSQPVLKAAAPPEARAPAGFERFW
jgi:hypothetical protein